MYTQIPPLRQKNEQTLQIKIRHRNRQWVYFSFLSAVSDNFHDRKWWTHIQHFLLYMWRPRCTAQVSAPCLCCLFLLRWLPCSSPSSLPAGGGEYLIPATIRLWCIKALGASGPKQPWCELVYDHLGAKVLVIQLLTAVSPLTFYSRITLTMLLCSSPGFMGT